MSTVYFEKRTPAGKAEEFWCPGERWPKVLAAYKRDHGPVVAEETCQPSSGRRYTFADGTVVVTGRGY